MSDSLAKEIFLLLVGREPHPFDPLLEKLSERLKDNECPRCARLEEGMIRTLKLAISYLSDEQIKAALAGGQP